MSDADAFLAAINDHPDDPAPRLVFADWLEERGESDRAEFIRVGCKLANYYTNEHFPEPSCQNLGPIGQDDCEECAAYRRVIELAALHPEWSPLPPGETWRTWYGGKCFVRATSAKPPVKPAHAIVDYRRGFIESVSLPLAAFLSHAADIFSQQPVTKVIITGEVGEPHFIDGVGSSGRIIHQNALPAGLWELLLAQHAGEAEELAMPPDQIRAFVWEDGNSPTPNDDIGRVAVAYGRQAAGLASLPVEALRDQP